MALLTYYLRIRTHLKHLRRMYAQEARPSPILMYTRSSCSGRCRYGSDSSLATRHSGRGVLKHDTGPRLDTFQPQGTGIHAAGTKRWCVTICYYFYYGVVWGGYITPPYQGQSDGVLQFVIVMVLYGEAT